MKVQLKVETDSEGENESDKGSEVGMIDHFSVFLCVIITCKKPEIKRFVEQKQE